MKRINRAAVVVCAALAALFALFPAMLGEGLGTDFAEEWLSPRREAFNGVLRVWHIGLWQAGKGGGAAYLAARGKEFEKKHPGVFVEVESMTPQGALDRFSRGESPDIASFPCGWGQASSFAALKLDGEVTSGVYAHLLESGQSGGKQLALPYMVSCYMLLYNEELFTDLELEISNNVLPAEFLLNSAKLTFTKKVGRKTLSYVGIEIPEISGNNPAAALLASGLVPAENSHIYGSAAFKAKSAGMFVGGMRDYAEPERYSFSSQQFPLTAFTDMVQYIGVWKNIREEALPYARDFAAALLGEPAQKKLEGLCAFPVRPLESMYDADPRLKELMQEIAKAGVPRTFSYAKRLADLEPLAKSALNGDLYARNAFLNRLGEACLYPSS